MTRNMKIFVDCIPLSSGGGVQVAIAFLENLRTSQGIDWQVAIPSTIVALLPIWIVQDSRTIVLAKQTAFDKFRLKYQLSALVRASHPDIVFTVFGPAYFRASVPQVVGFALPRMLQNADCRNLNPPSLVSKMADCIRRYLMNQTDHVVVETDTARNSFLARFKFSPSNVSVIRNSVNPILTRMPVDPQQASVGETFRILVPSAYYKHKNLEIVPAVAKSLRHQLGHSSFLFCLTLPHDLPAWKHMQRVASDLGVGSLVTSLGTLGLPELSQAYSQASAIFLPTLMEVSTAVYPESFYFRRPLVTSDLDFARELCGEAALFVKPTDAGQIASSIRVLMESGDLRRSLVEEGVRQLNTYPSPDEKFRQQIHVLKQIAKHRS